MKNFKKVLLVSAISVAMLSLFAGCKKAEEAADPADAPAVEETLTDDNMGFDEAEEAGTEEVAEDDTTSEATEEEAE